MQTITEEQVESTCEAIAQLDPAIAADMMMEFSISQPNLLGFVMAFAEDLDEEEAQELSTYMLYVVYQMFANASSAPIPMISEEQIHRHYEATCELVDSLHETDPLDEDVERETRNQPFIYRYVSETLLLDPEHPEHDIHISEENAAELFLLLKCVIDSVDEATG